MVGADEARWIGEIIDRLVSVPVYTGSSLARRPVLFDLYDAARAAMGEPLAYRAARILGESAARGGTVILTTGFIVPPWLRAENDGPVGAATLGRALSLACDATPVFVTEASLTGPMAALAEGAGLGVEPLSVAPTLLRRAAVVPFTTARERAAVEAERLLDATHPACVVAIEKAAPNEKGEFHSGVGFNLTPLAAKVDVLIAAARDRGIPTIGIGDGGNEIGMGVIKETVKRVLPTGAQCGCPCGGGVHAETVTDHLVVAAVSNWGATAIEAHLALAIGSAEILHDASLEGRLLDIAASAGLVDPAQGLGAPSGDAIAKSVHQGIVEILQFIVRSRLADDFYIRRYKHYVTERRAEMQAAIDAHAARVQEE